MNSLRKIPLEMLIQILEDLYNGGADYVDILGEADGEQRDTIKFIVKPEYISDFDEEDDDEINIEQKFELERIKEDEPSSLSEEDINDLI
jgi:predicted lipid-binding transport protein (Tim44 family)